MWRHWREVSANGRWRWGAVDGDGAVLSDEDMEELKMLATEPLDKDTMTLSEFDNIMEQWRMK